MRFFVRLVGLLVRALVALALVGIILFLVLPRLLNWELQVVLSGSMEPALPVGSVTFVQPSAAERVEVDDMLTYRLAAEPTKQVTHRVVEVVREGESLSFVTKGDANEEPDSYMVPAENVIGTVRWHIPYLGYLAGRLRTPQGFLLLVAVPGVVIIGGEVANIVRTLRQQRRKRFAARQRGDGL